MFEALEAKRKSFLGNWWPVLVVVASIAGILWLAVKNGF